jgi:septal ring factor EnvC (AmiA/AmiB activator)
MKDDTLQDLKQFITTVVRQEVQSGVSEIKTNVAELKTGVFDLKSDVAEIKTDIKRLDTKIDSIAGSVVEALNASEDETQDKIDNHEARIKKLETQSA